MARCLRRAGRQPVAIAPLPAIPSFSPTPILPELTRQSGAYLSLVRMSAQQGREVVIVEAVRTPIGRGHPEKGYYKDTHPNELLGTCFTEVIERAGIDPAEVEDVIAGCVQQIGEQSWNIARNAWLQAGLPIEAAATTVDRQCGSAQQAVNFGAALIAAGIHDVVIGSGVEHLGRIPMGVGLRVHRAGRHAVAASADGEARPHPAGAERRADRRAVGDPALRARRARRALAPARPPGHRGGPLRAGDRPVCDQRRHALRRPGHPARHEPRDARPAQARVQAGRPDHGGDVVADLRRRGGGAAHVAREGRRARAARRARGSSTRRRSASTR